MDSEPVRADAMTTTDDTTTTVAVPLRLLDKALEVQAPLAGKHVARIRVRHPDASPKAVVKRLNAEFRAATISAGAGVGAAAAAPGVGTGLALAISGGESVAFLNATVLYILARAEVQGIPVHNVERRRTLVMAIMLGEAGAASVSRVAERTGQHWARRVVTSDPPVEDPCREQGPRPELRDQVRDEAGHRGAGQGHPVRHRRGHRRWGQRHLQPWGDQGIGQSVRGAPCRLG